MENTPPIRLLAIISPSFFSNFFLELLLAVFWSFFFCVHCLIFCFIFIPSFFLFEPYFERFVFQLYLQDYFLFTCISNLCFFLNPPSFHFTLQNLFLTFHPDHLNNGCFQIPWTLLLSAVLSDFSHLFHLLTFSGGVDVSVDLLMRGRCYCEFFNFFSYREKGEHTGLPGV